MDEREYDVLTYLKTLAGSFPYVPEDRFQALRKAVEMAGALGFARGSQQRDAPIGLMHPEPDFFVSKWRNMSQKEIDTLHGVILFPHGSEGPCEVWVRPDLDPTRGRHQPGDRNGL